MNKLIVFLASLFFLSSGFVKPAEPSEKDNIQKREFLEFLSHFEKVSLPYSLNLKTIERSHYSNSGVLGNQRLFKENSGFNRFANKFIPMARMGKFSRMGRPRIEPIARFYQDDQTIAVIYTFKLTFSGPMHAGYHIAYYDLKGNLIGKSSKKFIGLNNIQIGLASPRESQTFTIFPSGKIKTTIYKNDWKLKPGSVSFDQNELLGFKKMKTIDYEFAGPVGIQEVAQAVVNARP